MTIEMLFYPDYYAYTGLLLPLRLYDSRATAVSPLSAFGRKGRLFVTLVLVHDGDVSLSLLIIVFLSFSLLVSLYNASVI